MTEASRGMRTLIAGVGYRNLRDHSLGVVLSDELEPLARPPALLIEDLSYGPVAVGQWLADETRVAPIDRAVFIAAVAREDGRAPGTVSAYRWDGVLPDADEIQRTMSEAVTGVILLDNTLIVTRWMDVLPRETLVIEVEPLVHEFGDGLSPSVAAAHTDARALVLRLATDRDAGDALPVAPLGGVPAGTSSVERVR